MGVLLSMSFLVQVGANIVCPHGGKVNIITSNTRVFISGQPVSTQNDLYQIAGCPFTIPSGPYHPCVQVKWLVPSNRILVNGQPAILQSSSGICQASDQAPQGAPIVVATQIRVKGL